MNTLQQAARAALIKWDRPLDPTLLGTSVYMVALRKALEAEQAQLGEPVAWVRENELTDLLSCNGGSIWAESPSIWFDEVPEHLVPVFKHLCPLPAREQAMSVEPFEIEFPDYHEQAMGCGLEDRQITDRYEAMRYGWDQALEHLDERLPDKLFTHPAPPPAGDPIDWQDMYRKMKSEKKAMAAKYEKDIGPLVRMKPAATVGRIEFIQKLRDRIAYLHEIGVNDTPVLLEEAADMLEADAQQVAVPVTGKRKPLSASVLRSVYCNDNSAGDWHSAQENYVAGFTAAERHHGITQGAKP